MKLYCSSHEDIIQRVGTYLVLTMVVIKLVQTTDENKINYANKTVQWNPVNTTTFGPWKFGRINGVVLLMG